MWPYHRENPTNCRRTSMAIIHFKETVVLVTTCITACVCQFLGGPGAVFNPCPDGFELQETSCYRFINISYSWAEAATTCGMMSAQLVEINGEKENAYLTQLVQSETKDWRQDSLGERIWTGGSNIPGLLLWMSSQAPVSYTSWHTGEPYTTSSKELICILKMQDDWYSDKCTHNRNFVCEKELDGLVIPYTTSNPVDNFPVG